MSPGCRRQHEERQMFADGTEYPQSGGATPGNFQAQEREQKPGVYQARGNVQGSRKEMRKRLT